MNIKQKKKIKGKHGETNKENMEDEMEKIMHVIKDKEMMKGNNQEMEIRKQKVTDFLCHLCSVKKNIAAHTTCS